VRFDWGDASSKMFVTVDTSVLAQIGAAIKEYGSIADATEAIGARIRPSISALRTQLNYLEREVDYLQDVASGRENPAQSA
jgi:hypothetical protein